MSRGILRSRISGSTMERRLQIEIYGLLRTAAIHTETDLYHRWVAAFLLMASRAWPKRDTAKINLIFTLSDQPAQNRITIVSLFHIACIELSVTVVPVNFVILSSGPNIESILLKSRLRALCIAAIVLSDASQMKHTRTKFAAKFLP